MRFTSIYFLNYTTQFKVHISFAITIAVEGFYPKNSAGYTITHFTSFGQALPLITLVISMVASSFGMTKFFLQGPIPILPKESPVNGLISLPFICTLIINSMFAVRMICIENSLFSSYRHQRYYDKDSRDPTQITIDPILPPEYRVLAYLAPCFISFAINATRLFKTGNNLRSIIMKYPQILLSPCFTPFAFEGCKENSFKIWRVGTICNAFFIGCLPQVVALIMEFHRGIVNWDFLGLTLSPEFIYENNDALFKSRYGNSIFAITTGGVFFFLIMLTFFTDKIFKKGGIYCKCFSILCFPCPNNCLDLDSEMPHSQPVQTNPIIPNNDDESDMEQIDPNEEAKEDKKPYIQIYIYPKRKKKSLRGNSLLEQGIELNEVNMKYSVDYHLFYKRFVDRL